MTSMLEIAPKRLDELVIDRQIEKAAATYADDAVIVDESGRRVVGRAAIKRYLRDFVGSISTRYYVKKEHGPEKSAFLSHGHAHTDTSVCWYVQAADGTDCQIEQRMQREWHDWLVTREVRSTRVIPPPAPAERVPLSWALTDMIQAMKEYSADTIGLFDVDFLLPVHDLPVELRERLKQWAGTLPFGVLAVLVLQLIRERGGPMTPEEYLSRFAAITERRLRGWPLPGGAEGRDASDQVVPEVRRLVTAFRNASPSLTRHDLVAGWLGREFSLGVVEHSSTAAEVPDATTRCQSIAHHLIDPLFQWWIRVCETTEFV